MQEGRGASDAADIPVSVTKLAEDASTHVIPVEDKVVVVKAPFGVSLWVFFVELRRRFLGW